MFSKSRSSGAEAFVDQEISDPITLGLHQATQPLTILQGTLELALVNANSMDEYKHAIQRSLEELQRVTDCFEHLRSITQLHRQVSDITTFAVSPMVKALLLSLKGRFGAAGVEFILQSKLGDSKDSSSELVRLSASRVSTALKMALLELLPSLESGDKVAVVIEAVSVGVLIRFTTEARVQAGAASADAVPPQMTPRQELALAMAASTGGELAFVSNGIFLRLPKALSPSLSCEIESGNGEVAHV